MSNKSNLKKYLPTIVIIVLVSASIDYNLSHKEYGWYKVLLNACFSLSIWFGCSTIADLFNDRYNWVDKTYQRLAIVISLTIAWLAASYLIFMIFWFLPEKEFLTKAHFNKLNFNSLIIPFVITSIISLVMYSRGFLLELKMQIAATEKITQEKLVFKYEMLRNQVNPHFLFNNLNVLSTLVHKDADLAEKFIAQMSKVYRYVLDNRMKEVVTVQEELNQLESYLYLMKIRFGDTFSFKIDIKDTELFIVPMTLQMIVENIFKHNEASKQNQLQIVIWQEHLTIHVHNNVSLKKISESPSGVGMQNIKDRYKFLSNTEVVIKSAHDSYEVQIPLLQ